LYGKNTENALTAFNEEFWGVGLVNVKELLQTILILNKTQIISMRELSKFTRENREKRKKDFEKKQRLLKEAEEKKQRLAKGLKHKNNELDEAVTTLNKVKEKVAEMEWKQNLAERLVGGLKDEYVRWKNNVETLSKDMELIVGVTLISAGFVC
jgi:septal ring factor EnvC (AmiA/AmiB activator)